MGEKTFTDAIGSGEISFYPDLDQIEVSQILDKPYRVVDAMIVRNFKGGEFGVSDFSLLLVEDIETGKQSTTLAGGQVLVERIQEVLDKKLFPLIGTIVKVKSRRDYEYYNIR